MNKLEEIVQHTRQRVAAQQKETTLTSLEQSVYFDRKGTSLRRQLLNEDMHGIIAEYKRQSPSKGVINADASVESTTRGYVKAGASALSILTEPQFFKGKNEDLLHARTFNTSPLLRKDFIVDEFQIIEAKSLGADVILLIASVLSKEEMKTFTKLAHQLSLEVLVEIRDKEEIENIPVDADIVGVNNRNLKTFSEGIEQSILLSEFIPNEFVKISESSIHDAKTIVELRKYGYSGFLIGEHFMRNPHPEKACERLITELNNLKKE